VVAVFGGRVGSFKRTQDTMDVKKTGISRNHFSCDLWLFGYSPPAFLKAGLVDKPLSSDLIVAGVSGEASM